MSETTDYVAMAREQIAELNDKRGLVAAEAAVRVSQRAISET